MARVLRAASATSDATAHEARRVVRESARLVRMIGTLAPSTMPAASAFARNVRLFASMLPASRSGTTRMLARPATGETIFLIFAAPRSIALSRARGPSSDAACDLPPVGHLAQRRSLDGRRDLGVHRLHGGKNCDPRLRLAQGMAEVDGVLDDINLGFEIRGDVDGGVGNDQGFRMVGNVHHKAVTYATRRAKSALALDDGGHQLVRVQAALHQGFRLAGENELHGGVRRTVAVRRIHDLELRDIDVAGRGGCDDLRGRPYENGLDQSQLSSFKRTLDGAFIAGMHDGNLQAGQGSRHCDQVVVFGVSAHHIAFPKPRARCSSGRRKRIYCMCELASLTKRNASEPARAHDNQNGGSI